MPRNPITAAKVVEPEVTDKKKKGKSEKERIELNLGKDLDVLAAGKELVKLLQEKMKSAQESIQDKIIDATVKHMLKNGEHPGAMTGIGPNSEAGIQVRKRKSSSPLNSDQVDLLEELDIPVETKIAREESFVINPEILQDKKLRDAVSKALAPLTKKGELLHKKDIFLRKPEESTQVISDESLEAIAACGNKSIIRTLLAISTEVVVKQPTIDLEESKLKEIMES